jgi:hypothetical protein
MPNYSIMMGIEGSPVHPAEDVIRYTHIVAVGHPDEPAPWDQAFVPSSKEREQGAAACLSVYVETLTSVAVGWRLLPNRHKYKRALRLGVNSICQVPRENGIPKLAVIWERALVEVDGKETVDLRPGAEGHAGIANTQSGSKNQRKECREQLAKTIRELEEITVRRVSCRLKNRMPVLCPVCSQYVATFCGIAVIFSEPAQIVEFAHSECCSGFRERTI